MELEKTQEVMDILKKYEGLKELLGLLQEKTSKGYTIQNYNPETKSNMVIDWLYSYKCQINILNKSFFIDDDTRKSIINVLIEKRKELEKEIKEL